MLKVNDLTIEPLFRKVNFCVPRGEIVTLMGPSGSGKSTLFAWMVGALSEDFQARGELWIGERRCDGLPVESRGLGILFQDALLFDLSALGKICCWPCLSGSRDAHGGKRSSRRWIPPGLAVITPAIRPPFPAESAPG